MSEEKALITVPKWSKSQVQLLARTVAKGASEDELKMFAYVCKRTALDPFLRQIYWIKRWDADLGDYRGTIQVGIDGLRLAGHRTKRVAGIGQPTFEIDSENKPTLARVSVFMFSETGEKIEFIGEARYSEYCQKKKDGAPTSMWLKMPFNQLAKCAEAQAWRKAAPAQVSGLVVHEEAIDVDFTVEGAPAEGEETASHAALPVSDSIQEGVLIGYEPAKEMPAEKGKKAKTRPGHVLIEVPEGKVKLTFFHRPEAFPDDAAAIAAASERAVCQFSFTSKGDYRNLATLVLKSKSDVGGEIDKGTDVKSSQEGSVLPPTPDVKILLADYRAEIEGAEDTQTVASILNRVLKDHALTGEMKVDLQAKGKKRMGEVK